MKYSRRELCYFDPTEAWLASRNPQGKKAILAWYEREKRVLKKRLHGPVVREFTANRVLVDRETKQPTKRSKKSTSFSIEVWRLSQQDHDVYAKLLDKRYERMKTLHNLKIKRKREAQNGG